MSAEEQSRLIADIAGGLSQVSRDDVIEKNLAHFHAADPEYGRRRRRSAPCARTEPQLKPPATALDPDEGWSIGCPGRTGTAAACEPVRW